MMIESKVFSRTPAVSVGKELSSSVYNLIIGLTLLWGFAVNAYLVHTVPVETLTAINPVAFLIVYFASCVAGIMLFSNSSIPAISFLGYNLVVVPFGLALTLVLSDYDPELVKSAITVTAIVTLIMMTLSTLFPRFFAGLGSILLITLFCVIVAELVVVFVFKAHVGIIDWIVAALFCGYIGYDWHRANNMPRTIDNAIDSAAAIYMDIINLFIRILRIMSGRN